MKFAVSLKCELGLYKRFLQSNGHMKWQAKILITLELFPTVKLINLIVFYCNSVQFSNIKQRIVVNWEVKYMLLSCF